MINAFNRKFYIFRIRVRNKFREPYYIFQKFEEFSLKDKKNGNFLFLEFKNEWVI